MSIFLVIAQLGLIAGIVIWPPALPRLSMVSALGLLLIIDSAALAIWAFVALRRKNFSVMPEPVTRGELCERGPYRFIRHPMYTAVIVGCLGACLVYLQPGKWFMLLLLIMVLLAKIHREERFLVTAYSEYAAYKARSKALVPGLY